MASLAEEDGVKEATRRRKAAVGNREAKGLLEVTRTTAPRMLQ